MLSDMLPVYVVQVCAVHVLCQSCGNMEMFWSCMNANVTHCNAVLYLSFNPILLLSVCEHTFS